jgi:hypothetical protein
LKKQYSNITEHLRDIYAGSFNEGVVSRYELTPMEWLVVAIIFPAGIHGQGSHRSSAWHD